MNDESPFVIGAWLTEEDVREIADDLEIDFEDALDTLRDPELLSELNAFLIRLVWDELKEDEND